MTLHIDTSSNEAISVSLTKDGKTYVRKEKLERNKSQILLSLIDELIKTHGNVKELSEITVERGPGSFTGLRVGVAVANTLSTVLQIPINGEKPGTIIEPVYE